MEKMKQLGCEEDYLDLALGKCDQNLPEEAQDVQRGSTSPMFFHLADTERCHCDSCRVVGGGVIFLHHRASLQNGCYSVLSRFSHLIKIAINTTT